MMKLMRRHIKLENKGFLLAEALFSVFATLLVVLILQNLLKSTTLANKINHKTDDVVFSYVQFNRFLKKQKFKYCYTKPAESTFKNADFEIISKNNEQKFYSINFYKNMIRVTTPEGGHMPLLINVSRASFFTKDEQIKIKVTEKDGRQSEIYLKFDPKPKKEKRNEKKKNVKS